jgi:3-methylfumaryl-CoA hydratase
MALDVAAALGRAQARGWLGNAQCIAMENPADTNLLETLRPWIGRSERRTDTVTAAPLAGLAATLDRIDDAAPLPGDALPPLAHWLYFLPQAPQRELGADGHPRRGGFLPPVPLPRRMWAGGRLQFERALHVGDAIERRSTITRVDAKHGRSGALVFVTVRHVIADAHGEAIVEEHDIVYRDHPQPGAPAPAATPAPTDEAFSRAIVPDAVLLFRYSALTFNGHRIHYDRTYVTEVEGYPGLIVHGPLIATLLVDLVRREMPGARIRAFTFKAASPLFDIHPFTVCGRPEADGAVTLWARNHEGRLAMQARAELAAPNHAE